MKERELKQYFRRLKKQLKYTYSSEQTDKIMKRLQISSDNYFLENPDASFEDFIEEFGNMEDLSLDFIENAKDLSKLTDIAPIRKKFYKIIIGILVFIFLFYWGLFLLDHIEQETTEIITIETISF